MRWNSVAVLVANTNRYQDETGAYHEGEPVRTQVFCNRYNRGFTDTLAPDMGLTEVAEIQVRAGEYSGEPRVELDGNVYEVEEVTSSGDFARIRLRRVIGSGG